MTSITSLGYQFSSPLQRLQSELSTQIADGAISASDESALSAALEDIDDAMQSQAQSDSVDETPPSPSDMQSKLDELISAQVESGNLTSDQADELKELFASAMPTGGPQGGSGPGGPPPPAEAEESDETTSSSDTDLQAVLEDFLKSLQETLDETSASYGADGRKSSVTASLVFDYQT
jgi:hypothetical protein